VKQNYVHEAVKCLLSINGEAQLYLFLDFNAQKYDFMYVHEDQLCQN